MSGHSDRALIALALLLASVASAAAGSADTTPGRVPRARDLGVPFDGTPGPLNAITDVDGVLVGQTTLIEGSGKLVVGKGPVRTGVTAVLPRGAASMQHFSFAGWYAQNGNGEMTGTTWVEESGFLEGPVLITNTHSVGVVRDAVIAWRVAHGPADATDVVVVAAGGGRDLGRLAERHQRLPREARARLSRARQRALRAGRGRRRRRRHRHDLQRLQGRHRHLPRASSPTRTAATWSACWSSATTVRARTCASPASRWAARSRATIPTPRMPSDVAERGSIIVVVATNAPLLPHQLKRIARRVVARHRPQRQHRRQWLGRYLHRLLDRQPRRERRRPRGRPEDGAERLAGPAVRRDGAGDRRGDRQRHGRGART